MKNCQNCQTQISDETLFCPKCGTKQVEQKSFCSGCGLQITKETVFCPRCGKNQKAQASNDSRPNHQNVVRTETTKLGNIFEIITKSCIAGFAFIMLFLLMFAPVSSSEIAETKYGYKYNHSGVNYVGYMFKVITGYDSEAYAEKGELLEDEFYEKYEYILENIKSEKTEEKWMAKYYKYVSAYNENLVYYRTGTYSDKTSIKVQCILPALFLIATWILLLILGIKSTISIFKRENPIKKDLKLLSISIAFILIVAFVLRLPGGNYFFTSNIGTGSVIALVLGFLCYGLYYTNDILNKKTKFNLKKTIMYPCFTLGSLVILILMTQSFLTVSARESYHKYSADISLQDSFSAFDNDLKVKFDLDDVEDDILEYGEDGYKLNQYITGSFLFVGGDLLDEDSYKSDTAWLVLVFTDAPLLAGSNAFICIFVNLIFGLLISFGITKMLEDFIDYEGNQRTNGKRIVAIIGTGILLVFSVMSALYFKLSPEYAELSTSISPSISLIFAFILALGVGISGNILLKQVKEEEKAAL